MLEERFPETVETQPELLAHHYTEAGRNDRAVDYWHKAGQKALARSAYVEAIRTSTQGWHNSATLPETSERVQQELDMQITLGRRWWQSGSCRPGGGQCLQPARALCQQVGETAEHFQVLWGLCHFITAAELPTARTGGAMPHPEPQRTRSLRGLISPPERRGRPRSTLGNCRLARTIWSRHCPLHPRAAPDPGAPLWPRTRGILLHLCGLALWLLGYPDQACSSARCIAISRRLSHPYSLAHAV